MLILIGVLIVFFVGFMWIRGLVLYNREGSSSGALWPAAQVELARGQGAPVTGHLVVPGLG